MTQYKVVKKHTGGLLEGLITEEVTSVSLEYNKEYTSCITGAKYVVIQCAKI